MSHVNGDDEGIDYSDIEAKYQIPFEEGFDSVLVVDNLPIVDSSKKEKLLQTLEKRFAKVGPAPKKDGMVMPWDDATHKSKGYVFAEFKTAEEANAAMIALQGFPFDKQHSLLLNRFTDIEKFANLEETYVEPEIEPFKPKEHLRSWLADPQCRDQYVTYRGEDVSVLWHGKAGSAEVANTRKGWTELYVSWSPNGTYLASIHRLGVRLWGGHSWDGLHRFTHPAVKLLDFSPCENYIVTWSPDPIVVPEGAPVGATYFSEEDEGNQIAVWEIRTGHLLRTFPAIHQAPSVDAEGNPQKKQMIWPALKWSADDKYVARVTPGQQISIYELPSMSLLGKKSVKIEGVVDFEWCPLGDRDRDEEAESKKDPKKTPKKERENMLAYWTPEISNQPARVTLMSFPSRTVLRSKNLFNVSDCKLYWQNQGDFLCVKVERHTKTKKSSFCNLEIFRVREKDFPVEVIEIKDNVIEFAWEPRGERFAIISTNDPSYGNTAPGITYKTDVSFYQLEKTKGDFKLLKSWTGKSVNAIRWSPRGRHLVLAALGSSQKFDLEFWDLDFTQDDRKDGVQPTAAEWGSSVQLLSPPSLDHYGVTEVVWDPSGRCVASLSSVWSRNLENGYAIWDFRGQELEKHLLDRFKQFLWRPRPRTLLGKEQQRQIRRNLKEFSRTFDEEDAAEESSASKELVAYRKRLVDEWNHWRAKVREELAAHKKRVDQEREDVEEVQEWVDELIDTVEEEILD